jgi:plasmid stabilization system protein ParE
VNFGVLPAAELEAALAAAWYEDQSAGLGEEFLAALEDAFQRISSEPQALPRSEGYRGGHEVRRCLLTRFPYVVSFVCRPHEVVIVAVSHVRRRPFYWLERLI